MKLVSFNVNSVRLRLPHLQALIEAHQPHVIGLQETKVTDEQFPEDEIRALGYDVIYCGQKTHYGVALLSRTPMENPRYGFDSDEADAQKRLIGADIPLGDGRQLRAINGYFPQGEARDHAIKFPAKEKFYADLQRLLDDHYSPNDLLAVMGDFNIAPVDNDIGIGPENAKRWLRSGKTSFLPEEREWFERLTAWGLSDSYRERYPEVDDRFSWFDYRSRGFEREPRRGLRIDHILTTSALSAALQDSGIDYDIRAMEKPSDHCPVWSSFDLN